MIMAAITAIIAITITFIVFLISLFPNIDTGQVINIGNDLLKYGLAFVPAHCWATFLSTVVLFNSYKFSWAIIEWLYKKIPGVS